MSEPTAARDPELPATVGDLTKHEKHETLVAWLSSGLGAVLSVVGVCSVLLGGSLLVVDRSEAAGAKAAAATQADLDEHKLAEARWHHWTESMLFRQDQKSDAVLLGLGLHNPAPLPPPRPPPPDLPRDAGQ